MLRYSGAEEWAGGAGYEGGKGLPGKATVRQGQCRVRCHKRERLEFA